MALITCPECGASVSSEAKVCPSCGRPINTQSKKRGRSSGFRTGAIIGLIGGIGLVGVFLLSVAALALSATALVFMVFLLNVLSICLGWLFLWQPVLEIAGSIKMLSNAMKYEA